MIHIIIHVDVLCTYYFCNFFAGLGWPLNYHFVFDLCAVLGVILIIISLFLPKSSETKRETLEGSSGVSSSTT